MTIKRAKKYSLLLLSVFFCNPIFSQDYWQIGKLKITENGHYLQFEDGIPFFWLGDTSWELFSRLTREEISQYLDNRSQKGFNVIQAVILANTDRPQIHNQYGELPLIDNNPEKPNEKYFELIDWTLQQAMQKGMFIGLLPTWGDKVSKFWGKGPEIFNEQNAYRYGLFLGKRYGNYPNIIWIAGGDRPAFTDSMDWRPVWRAMIKGIREGSKGKTLVTYHPWGEHSSFEFWGNENTLDLNMVQSGHARHDVNVWKWITQDFQATPTKPVLDGEPNYEDHPVNWKVENGYFRDYDVRKQLYRSVFSGACGVTYGHQAVWQFYSSRENPIVFPDRYWTEALDRPGAFQAGYLKKLILSRPSLKRIPDQTLIKSGQGENGEYITAFRDEDNSYAMIYLPVGKKIEVNTSWMTTDKIIASWFNPRTGKSLKIGEFKKENSISFESPSTGIENDWVLILDTPESIAENSEAVKNTGRDMLTQIEKEVKTGIWNRFEIMIKNDRSYKNPFADVDLLAEFTGTDSRKTETWGFFDGSGTWKLRFMPDQTGEWTFVAWFSDQPQQKIPGTFQCVPSNIPGLISADETNRVWFGFKGGKHIFIRSFHVGDRFFASNWPADKRNEFLDWAVQNKYNTLSIASHYLNRDGESRGRGWNTPNLWDSEKQHPDPAEYAKMESLLDDLAARKIIVFPFAGFFGQSADYPKDSLGQVLYLKYTIARLGTYWNLLYSVSGPEPLLRKLNQFTKEQIDGWGIMIASMNASGHLLTVHNPTNENPFVNACWANYQCLQGPKTVHPDSLYLGLMTRRNPKQPLYAQETLWYGNMYHHKIIGHEYTDDDLRRNAWIIAMAGAALNFADNNGNSSTGFSGTLDLDERHQDKHEIIGKVWDFFESIPFYQLSPSPDFVDNGFCLAKPGETYLVYLPYGGKVSVTITPELYTGVWIKGSDTAIRIPIGLNKGQNLQAPSGDDWLLYLTNNNKSK